MENSEIKNHLESKFTQVIQLPYRSLIIGVSEYIHFLVESPLWPTVKERIKNQLNKERKTPIKLRSYLFSNAWKQIVLAYDVIYDKEDLNELLDETFNYSTHLNNDSLRESFGRIHSFISDNIFLLQSSGVTKQPSWGWFDKKSGEYQFGSIIFKKPRGKRGSIFQELMDLYETSPQGISVNSLCERTDIKSHRRLRIEINAINTKLREKIGFYLKGSGKGFYFFEKLSHKETSS